MKLTEAAQDAYDALSDTDKEALKFAKEVLGARILYGVIRTTLVHLIGRKVAPQIFTSFGRSYVIALLARLAVTPAKLTDAQKDRALQYKEALRREKEAKEAGE